MQILLRQYCTSNTCISVSPNHSPSTFIVFHPHVVLFLVNASVFKSVVVVVVVAYGVSFNARSPKRHAIIPPPPQILYTCLVSLGSSTSRY